MKKTIRYLLILVVSLVVLTGCGSDDDSSKELTVDNNVGSVEASKPNTTQWSKTGVTSEVKITGLYVAYFKRAPDLEGLSFWKNRATKFESQKVLKELSAGFAKHPTFVSTYSLLNNRAFVETIYQNVLGKDGDAEGIKHWIQYLDNGNSRSDMVSDFVETSLSVELTIENFPNLTKEELLNAKNRQTLLTNKVTVALNFTTILGKHTNIVNVKSPENDPVYLASSKILSNVTVELTSVSTIVDFIETIKEDDDPIDKINNPTVTKGYLVDSPLQGVTYTCDGKEALTDASGMFECLNLPVTFKIGELTIGVLNTFTADSIVYPQDLLGLNRANFSNSRLKLLARFLQSLDDDGVISEKINITQDVRNKFTVVQNFEDMSEGDVASLLRGLGSNSLPKECGALKHLGDTDVTCNSDGSYYVYVPPPATSTTPPPATSTTPPPATSTTPPPAISTTPPPATSTTPPPANLGSKRFTLDTTNGTALDTQTKLLWQNSGLGHSARDLAITRCDNLDFAGFSDWRLSTKAESKIFHSEMNGQGDIPQQTFSGCTAEVVSDAYIRTKKGAETYGGEPGDAIGFSGGANVRCVRTAGGSPGTITPIEDKIVERHNYYRNLEFTDSNLTWDTTLATHAQQWADYLVANYTSAHRASGQSPHASQFNQTTHGIPYQGEGENIAWSSNGRGYLTDSPIDISDVAIADGSIQGSVDAWASEKAYYDYATNEKKSGYENKAVGHYTQLAWQKTTKIGCGKASGTDGEHVVCRYSIAGNLTGTKPYCSNYTISDLYTDSSLVFTNAIIENSSFGITKVLEDRSACTRNDTPDSTLTFTGTSSASLPNYNAFNTADGSNLWSMNFDDISIDGAGQLIMTNTANNRYMRLKMIGENSTHYMVEAYWWVNGTQYNRRAILKLAK